MLHNVHTGKAKRTDDKLARMEMTKSGMVLKKQTNTNNKKPISLFRTTSAVDLFRFSQIYTGRRRGEQGGDEEDNDDPQCLWD